MIEYAWIFKPREPSCWLKKWLILSRNLAIWEVYVLEKVLYSCFSVAREINSRFCSKIQWQMFLLVSGRHVGAHPDGHQHGVSIQIFINLGTKIYPYTLLKRNCCELNLGENFAYLPSFFSDILDVIHWRVFTFILINFEWRETENQLQQKTAARLAQLVERQPAVREVEGSSPRPDQHSGS